MASPFTILSGKKISVTSPPNLIMIEYDPELSPRVPFGEKIVLVQSVFLQLDGVPLLPSEFFAVAVGFNWKDPTCLKGKTNRGMSIDAIKNESHPYYNDSFDSETASNKPRPDWVVGQISFADLHGREMSVAVDLEGSHNTLRYAESRRCRAVVHPGNQPARTGYELD
jgi:hypothetical protein